MYYFIYKTTSESGNYYIGRHSTKNINDNYLGSGKWVRSIKNKNSLTREILEYCDSEQELRKVEEKYLLENVGKEKCMNFNLSSCGFSSGDLNPSSSEEGRKKISFRVRGDNNPSKREDVRLKISISNKRPKGKWLKPMSDTGRQNISNARKGIKYSPEGIEKLKANRKKTYENKGIIPYVPSFSGKTHDEETLKRMKISHSKIPKLECPHCGLVCKPAQASRWHFDNCKKKQYEKEQD